MFLRNCGDCALPCDTIDFLQKWVTIIRIVAPILTIALISKDIFTAAAAGKDDDMKKAQRTALIRIIVLVIIFFTPAVVSIIMNLAFGSGPDALSAKCDFARF